MAKFELSKKKVLKQFEIARSIADEVTYSFKTNYEVGKLLEKETKCNFGVHSLQAVKKLDDKTRIWYFPQAWDEDELKELFELKIDKFVVDNEEDLNRLLKFISDKEVSISLLLRMRLKENTVKTGKHFVYGFFSKQVNELVPKLSENKKIKSLGVHTHRKTQNVSEWDLQRELEQSLTQETFEKLQIINIGGGLPGVYKNFRPEVVESVVNKIKETKTWLNSKEIKMLIEPGRFIAGSSVNLITNIKSIYNNNIVIDCSVYNSAMDTFVAHIRLLVENELEEGEAFTIKGCTPDSMDIFRYKVYLKEPKIGDKLVFLNAGAYNFTTEFCMLPKLETIIVD